MRPVSPASSFTSLIASLCVVQIELRRHWYLWPGVGLDLPNQFGIGKTASIFFEWIYEKAIKSSFLLAKSWVRLGLRISTVIPNGRIRVYLSGWMNRVPAVGHYQQVFSRVPCPPRSRNAMQIRLRRRHSLGPSAGLGLGTYANQPLVNTSYRGDRFTQIGNARLNETLHRLCRDVAKRFFFFCFFFFFYSFETILSAALVIPKRNYPMFLPHFHDNLL